MPHANDRSILGGDRPTWPGRRSARPDMEPKGWTMLTRHPTRRIRLLVASLALAISAAFGAVGIAAAESPNRAFEMTACATPNGKVLIQTVSWSGMPVSAWSFFIESTEGSGGTFQPVPTPGDSGELTNTFATDVDTIQSVSATVFRSAGGSSNYVELDSLTLPQPVSGWSRC